MLALSRWKIILVLGSVIFGILFSLPNVLPNSVLARWPAFLPRQRLNLGLDLQGGSSLLYAVDMDALRKDLLNNSAEDVRTSLGQAQIGFDSLTTTGGVVQLHVTDPSQMQAALTALAKVGARTSTGGRDINVAAAPGQIIRLSLVSQALQADARNAVDQSIEIIRRRIDKLGIREPDIRRQGADRISIEEAGESNPEKLKAIVGKTAKLTFQLVDENVAAQALTTPVPPGDEVLPTENPDEPFLVVKKRVDVSGDMLTNAQSGFDPQTGEPIIEFRLNGVGTRRFAQVTVDNLKHRFAIVLDNQIISAPVINSPIVGGSGEITGNFTADSAHQLAVELDSGALPAQLKVLEEGTVGADLGADAVRAGVTGLAVGGSLIFAFIFLAYGLFGAFAGIALVVNLLMMLGTLSMSQATLTLPGIAGLILTLAVAVDANVLIYERMRDEANAGRNAIAAADTGYRRAMSSIMDANVTTMISALIMFNMGVGPVRGFALTLSIGVVTSVFTAIVVTQILIGWWFRVTRSKILPIA